MEGLTEGRIVHYVLEGGRNAGQHRPAIIVKVWGQDNGCCNLTMFPDWSNDGLNGMEWQTSRLFSESGELGTWHWIERA